MSLLYDQSAFSSCHVGFSASSVCEHLLVYCFKGACLDLSICPNALSLHTFEPMKEVDFEFNYNF